MLFFAGIGPKDTAGRVLSSFPHPGNEAKRLNRLLFGFIVDKADFVPHFVTEQDLERARCDLAFRQQLMAGCLERLLAALQQMRDSEDASLETARHLREGVDLAGQLADRLQRGPKSGGPQAA